MVKFKTKKTKRIMLLIIILLFIAFLIIACNQRLIVRHYTIESEKLSKPFRVAVVADLHSCFYGENQQKLISAISSAEPDVVLLVGDIIDDDEPIDGAVVFLERISQMYPCYYVTGNHEAYLDSVDDAKTMIRDFKITVLEGECDMISINGQSVQIIGVDDPDVCTSAVFSKQLDKAFYSADESVFMLLLSHRPERIEQYLEYPPDLIVSGHAHGGHWRIPGILNGVYSPDQGLFPKYAGGVYEHGETIHIVSRGLSIQYLIPRIFNRPELVIIDVEPA